MGQLFVQQPETGLANAVTLLLNSLQQPLVLPEPCCAVREDDLTAHKIAPARTVYLVPERVIWI